MSANGDGASGTARPNRESVASNAVSDYSGVTDSGTEVLAEQFAALQVVGQHSLDLMVVIDDVGRIKYANPPALAIFGGTLEDSVGVSGFEWVHPEDLERVTGRFEELLNSPGASIGDTVRTLSRGEVHVLELIATNCFDQPSVCGIVINATDVTLGSHARGQWTGRERLDERNQRETEVHDAVARFAVAEAMSQSEERFRLAFEDNLAPMIITDLDDRSIAVNDAFCQMIGYSREEILGRDSTQFTYPEDIGITEESHRKVSQGEVNQVRYTKRYVRKDGRVIVIESSRSPARDAEGKTIYFIISQREITGRVQREHVLFLLSEVNKLALTTTSEADFLQRLCRIFVEEGHYPLVWIGVPSPTVEGDVEITYAAGMTDYLYPGMVSWWGSKDNGLGPTGKALRTGLAQVVGDMAQEENFEPWRERAAQFGLGSAVAIPVFTEGHRAVLAIYSEHFFSFDDVTVKALEEVVRELELAVTHLRSVERTEAALKETTTTMRQLSEAENALTESEQRFRIAFENNMAPMTFTDLDDRIISANDAFCAMVGFEREELVGNDSTMFTLPEDVGITEDTHRRLLSGEVEQVRYVKRYLRKDGRIIVVEVSRAPARDAAGNILYFVFSERDVTQEQALAAELRHQALHDPLTGLANRVLFEDRLAQAHARVDRSGGFGAVLLLDLDDFKGVNDTYGHLVGDQLLMGIARRFEMVTRSTDTLSRFGGDEFLYLAEGLASATQAEDVAHRLLDVLLETFSFDGVQFDQHASVGVVVWDRTSADVSQILQNADVALYEAKAQGKGRLVVFTPSMLTQAVSRFTLVQEMRHALQCGEISMHYQPIVNLETTVVLGFEALMRWEHPERGWIPPNVFIPLAEQSDLILELGSLAVRHATAAASEWQRTNPLAIAPYVTVNLSAHQFHDPGLVSMVKQALADANLAPDRLIFEITESVALLDVTETLSVMDDFRRLGIGIALDDFGTGYSSLSYLLLLNPAIIKIDRCFVSPATKSDHNDMLLGTIISLGNNLQMTMVAEGIETLEQLELLRRLNCRLGQGFLFSPAVAPGLAVTMVGTKLG